MMRAFLVGCLVVLLSGAATSFYLPGVAPRDFHDGDVVDLKVNSVTSFMTKLPYKYYSLKFCEPEGGVKDMAENLGEVLSGDRIENSPYELIMGKNEYCKVLCTKKLTKQDTALFRKRIDELYSVNMIVDNLPAATEIPPALTGDKDQVFFETGWPVGGSYCPNNKENCGRKRRYYLHNHLSMKIMYHVPKENMLSGVTFTSDGETVSSGSPDQTKKGETARKRVVRFEIEPFTVRHALIPDKADPTKKRPALCTDRTKQQLVHLWDGYEQDISKGAQSVTYTYDVIWMENKDVKWATRWDVYLSMGNRYKDDIHWFSIVNSLLIVLFLSMMVGMIMMRTLYRDLARYNRVPTDEEKAEDREDSGWKLVHADVFRPPPASMIFSVVVGTGVQCFGSAGGVLTFAALGFLSPANRGSLMTALIVVFVIMGMIGGYSAARMYKTFKGTAWQCTTLMQAFIFPGIVFGMFFILNFFVWGEASTAAVPFGTMVAVMALWFGVSVPLTFFGAFLGFRRDVIEYPVRTADIPRQIPEQPWYLNQIVLVLVGGLLPFGAIFVELFFILTSIWLDQYYYVFGFLLVVCMVLIITCAEITIVMGYFQLCSEDYRWWWNSFLVSGSSAIYVFVYSVHYFYTQLNITKGTTSVLYFGYMAVISLTYFFASGIIGFSAMFYFNRRIFGAVKVD
jgi:transmembrane 9 superfamily member 2/4